MKKKQPMNYLGLLLKIGLLIVFVMPFYTALCYAFKSKAEIAATGLSFPTSFSFENFTKAVEQTNQAGMPFWTVIGNTLLVTIVGTAALVLLSTMAAYVIARRKGKFYKLIYVLLIFTLLVPIQAYMFPLYDLLRELKLLNTLTGFTLAKIGSQIGYSVIITTGFVKGIPFDIEEAALIDGATVTKMFFKIVMPLLRPIILTSIVINALSIWNDFALGFIVLTDQNKYIVSLLQFSFIGSNSSQLNLAFALFSLTMIPILILYLVFQKYIISGIAMGSVKG